EHPCPDFSESRCLLINGNSEAAGDQRVRSKQPANSASNDHDSKLRLRHRLTHKMLRKLRRSSYPPLPQTPSGRADSPAGHNTTAAGGVWNARLYANSAARSPYACGTDAASGLLCAEPHAG